MGSGEGLWGLCLDLVFFWGGVQGVVLAAGNWGGGGWAGLMCTDPDV